MIKIIFALFPRFLWLALGTAVIVGLNNNLKLLSAALINIILLFIFIRLGIILHEIGHLISARLVGGIPRRMILGMGHEVSRFKCYGVKIIVNSAFKGGFALANFNQHSFIKLRKSINIAGGPATNLLLAYLFFYFFGFDPKFLSGKNGVDLNSAFIASNTMIGIFSLIPYYVNYQGIKIPTDGLSLIKLPFKKMEKFKKEVNQNAFFEAMEFLEVKEYDKAQEIYEKYSKIDSTAFVSKLNLGLVFLKKGEIENSYKMHRECLELSKNEKNKNLRALLHNNMAWLYLLRGEYSEADYYSKVAYSINLQENNFKGTRGAALIENGKTTQGIKMLQPLVDFKYPNSQTLCAAMYLSYAFFVLDKEKEKSKYFKFVENYSDKLDKDERLLWSNIRTRIHPS